MLHKNTAAGAPLSVHRLDMMDSGLQNGLQYLDFSNMDLTGSLPSCLLSAPGTLSQIGLFSNNLTGTIPDVIPTNTSLHSLVLDNNNLTGSIPATLVNARLLWSCIQISLQAASQMTLVPGCTCCKQCFCLTTTSLVSKAFLFACNCAVFRSQHILAV